MFFFLLPLSLYPMSQNDFENTMNYLRDGNFEKVKEFLTSNKNNLKNDPDYYIILLNYSYKKGASSGIVVSSKKPKNGDLTLIDTKSGKTIGSMGERTFTTDKDLILNNIRLTQEALKHFKDRLDIHFGIMAIARRLEEWKIIEQQSIIVLKISKEVKNQWKWGYINSMNGDPEEFMLNNIESHCSDILKVKSTQTNEIYKNISTALIKYYPDKVYGYTNLGTYYYFIKDYRKAEEFYKKGLTVNPNDKITLNNLKYIRKLLKKTKHNECCKSAAF